VDETAIEGIAGFIQKRFDLIKDSVLLIAAGTVSTLVSVPLRLWCCYLSSKIRKLHRDCIRLRLRLSALLA
jgi:hypothetical protein